MKNYIYLFLITVALFSCDIENKKPEFKRIENVDVSVFTERAIEVKADAIIYNPNGVSVYLQKTEIDVFANEIKVSHISQTENTEITKKSEFKIPLVAKFKPQDLIKDEASIIDIISNSIKTFKDKKIELRYTGVATFKIAGIEFDVPVKYSEVVELK